MLKKCMIALAVVVLMVSVVSAADPAIQAIDLCKFPVYMDVGHFVQLPQYNNCMYPVYTDAGYYVEIKDCDLRKLNLVQVDCEDIGKSAEDFPCYSGCETIEVRANFPAIFGASLAKVGDILDKISVYWTDDINRIEGTGAWEELGVCVNAWKVAMPAVQDLVKVGEITIITIFPPVADAGPDQTVKQTSAAGAEVQLDGSGSSDPDGDLLTYDWTWSIGEDTYNATGINPTIELPVGKHIIQLIVNDGIFNSEPDYVEITILNANLSGWVWIEESSDFGYSLDEKNLVYFVSSDTVWNLNLATGQWVPDKPAGWIYINWPFYYSLL
ncbi:MAG: PKD domain-containing protein [Planctomycetota bacterium]